MLTKDLVICRCSGKRLLPVFQKTDDAELLELAERLIGACEPNGTFTRGDMLQTWSDVTTGYLNTKLLNGLRKILEDRAQFTSSSELDLSRETSPQRKSTEKPSRRESNRRCFANASTRTCLTTTVSSPSTIQARVNSSNGTMSPSCRDFS